MTAGRAPGYELIVLAVDDEGSEVVRLALGHGQDPNMMLAEQGWAVRGVRDAVRDPAHEHLLTITFLVWPLVVGPLEVGPLEVGPSVAGRRTDAPGSRGVQPRQPRPDDDLLILEGEVARRHQRVAAYAMVTSSRGLLMTQFSDRTNASGQWGLPGGGLEADEAPDRAVLREVWEESGQVIEANEVAMVSTSHWLGRAPTGQLEDFHAVRVIYRAVCLEPTEPVVHDVGGTTAAAAWLLPADLDLLALTAGWRSILGELAALGGAGAGPSGVVMAPPDETDGTDHHHDDTQADDRARPQP